MSTGRIVVELTANQSAQPIRNAEIVISDSSTNRVVARLSLKNSQAGKTETISVDAPNISLSLNQESQILPYAIYNVSISAPGFYGLDLRGVQVFADRTSIVRQDLIPLPQGTSSGRNNIDIPTHSLFAPTAPLDRNQVYDNSPVILSRVVIPEYVTVHLGRPNESARNVTVSFPSYIKNVCCSEIYSTWPVEAIKANIYAQISLVLNRIYTEWYRSRGYNFDITNSTAYDQYFVYGRNIEQNISDLVDGMFTMYVRKVGTVNPYYTEYCDGNTVWCPGMKQWGTVSLANNGYNALQILRYYYGTDIEIVEADVVEGVPSSYPGTPLRIGSSGSAVATIQRQLSRIAQNYPAIGFLASDGVFGESTEAAVKRFQSIFDLTSDGVVGLSTWYKISYIYVAVKKLAELSSEGETYAGEGVYPGTPLRLGSTGSNVSSLQYYINVIANAVNFVRTVTIDGVFGSATENSVRQIQSLYGLVVDGIVGRTTWDTIYNLYKGIIDNADISIGIDYPGTPLSVGSRGDSVLVMQRLLSSISAIFTEITPPTPDGIFGGMTEAAVEDFQELFSLEVDGIIGENTWDKIVDVYLGTQEFEYGGSALSLGSSGDEVSKLQELLNYVGRTYMQIPALNVDGAFGTATQSAVIEFQRLFSIAADGVVGPITWNALLKQYLLSLYGSGSNNNQTYPGYPLEIGSQGEAVHLIQRYLNYIGTIYKTVPSLINDGIYGPQSAEAVSILQGIFSLSQTGTVDETTWNLIINLYNFLIENQYGGAALYEGSTGENVTKLQEFLNYIGRSYPSIPPISADGTFGPATNNAVIAYQRQFSLTDDGIVGINTWNSLLREYYILFYDGSPQSEEYPGSPLSVGSTGSAVLLMQSYLNNIAAIINEIPTLTEDGNYGPLTSDSVSIFQQIFELSSDGVIGEETWNKIVKVNREIAQNAYGGEVLRQGSSGAAVVTLQNMLSALNGTYPQIPLLNSDGIFGPATENAVTVFQQLFSLSADGIVGQNTWNTLLKEYIIIMNTQNPISSDIYPGYPIQYGSTGQNVTKMKNYLNIIEDYYTSMINNTANNSFDRRMETNVRAFQNLFSLDVDGVIGEETWNKIVDIKTLLLADAYAGTLLRYGSSGSQVRKVQQYLNALRPYHNQIPALSEDGIFGYNTQNAVIAYQRLSNLPADGIVGPNTWNTLIGEYYIYYNSQDPRSEPFPGTLLRVGSTGSDVLKMQRYLNIISNVYTSIRKLAEDSIFGNNTRSAVVSFQRIFSLAADGIIGENTWNKIVDVKNSILNGNESFPNNQTPEQDAFTELSIGSKGADVLAYQKLINRVAAEYGDIPTVEENGIFGFALRNTTIALQKLFGIEENGKFTKELYDLLSF